jgi:hypothetical protein
MLIKRRVIPDYKHFDSGNENYSSTRHDRLRKKKFLSLRLKNLQILCLNCHSFTDNYRGKNMGMSAQKETFEVEAG